MSSPVSWKAVHVAPDAKYSNLFCAPVILSDRRKEVAAVSSNITSISVVDRNIVWRGEFQDVLFPKSAKILPGVWKIERLAPRIRALDFHPESYCARAVFICL